MHFPPKFLQKRSPLTFSMVHLLHRLYGVDAPDCVCLWNVPSKCVVYQGVTYNTVCVCVTGRPHAHQPSGRCHLRFCSTDDVARYHLHSRRQTSQVSTLPLLYITQILRPSSQSSALVLTLLCSKGDTSSQWSKSNFDTLGGHNPWTDLDKSWHGWLGPPPDPTCQKRWLSERGVAWGYGWSCHLVCFFI